MKTKILLGCILSLAIVVNSCSDLLEEDPKGKLTPVTYFSTLDELNMAVYSLYEKVMKTKNDTDMALPNWQGDDITTHPASNKQAAAEFDRFAPADNNKGVIRCWEVHMTLIKAANYIILNADRTPTTDAEKNNAIGQARYWRAYAYFTLVRVWGPLPLNLDNVIVYDTPLSSVQDVYNLIIEDLKYCEANLPTNHTAAPRKLNGVNVYITSQAAKSTLVAVYMAMAGYPLNKGAEYYGLAKDKAKEIIDGCAAGTYEYVFQPDMTKVYAPSNNYNNETCVGINYSGAFTWGQDSQLTSTNFFESIGGWGDAWGAIKFWKEMPEGVRKDTYYNPKILVANREGNDLVDWWAMNGEHPYFPERHPMMSVFTVGPGDTDYDYTKRASEDMTNGHRHRLIRYAEILLWYAESQARADGAPNALAYECINKVRNRAGLADLPTGMSGDDFAEAAFTEHGWEVAGYYVGMVTRRADLFRMDRLKDVFASRLANVGVEVAPGVVLTETIVPSGSWNDNLNYAPYPYRDASLNPNLKR